MRGHLSDDLSDIARAQARRWCQDLINLGRLHTGAECIGMLSELFNLTESQALTLISEHLYGSSLKEEWRTFACPNRREVYYAL